MVYYKKIGNLSMNAKALVEKNMICKVMEGSHAYGTSTPTSDVDMRGIFCAEPINILTPFFPIKEVVDETEEDTKFFELRHFMQLLIQQNPNIIQILWVRDEDVITSSPAYEYLRSMRSSLISSRIAFTTSGYAHAQLKRIKGHNKWIMNPQPEEAPQQKDYIKLVQWFGNEKILPNTFNVMDFVDDHFALSYGDQLYGLYQVDGRTLIRPQDGSLNDNFDGDRNTLPQPIGLIKLDRAHWKEACDIHTNYWTWKKNRNEVRSQLEEDYGIDTKHASHLVRLLRMGYEALTDGVINVYRPDAAELLDIRNGSMSYDEILEYADDMDAKIKEAYKNTALPHKVDTQLAAQITMNVQTLTWEKTT